MWYKDEDSFSVSRDRDRGHRSVRIELPPPFSGEERQSFVCWARQFEVSVRALTDGSGAASYNYELTRILPTRLSDAAFSLWDSLSDAVKSDYDAVKEKLKEAFGRRQFMERFRASLSARPRAARESLEVYAAEISRLVDEAFPEYGDRAQREEKFRRFVAGLDPVLRSKCYEQGATDMEEAVIIAGRCENARNAMDMGYVTANVRHNVTADGAVGNVNSVSDISGLYRTIERLTDEVKGMKVALNRLEDENHRMKERWSRRGTDEWWKAHSPSRESGQCCCQGRACRVQTYESQRGRSSDRKPFVEYTGRMGQNSTRSPMRRTASPSPSPRMRRRGSCEEVKEKQGVRFMTPSGEERNYEPGNGL